ncbi:MAG: HNH endonuclease, partial [Marmoricola sp.]|nr:HNH endonuclease [Marmoricola sp.]
MTNARTPRKTGPIAGAVLLAALCATGCATSYGAPTGSSAGATSPVPSASPRATHPATPRPTKRAAHPEPGSAAALVATLPVRGRGPMTGYSRERFGQAWLDADRNGCDTRDDLLRRDLHAVTVRAGTHGCVVTSGILDDPYTGRQIRYVRDQSFSVDVDHVVALGTAWVSGAARWDIRQRAALANDPLDLLPVDASA